MKNKNPNTIKRFRFLDWLMKIFGAGPGTVQAVTEQQRKRLPAKNK